MAIDALPGRNCMRARQHKIHRGVIEARRLPRRRGVALEAIRREIGSHVVRVRRALKILQVARQASRGGQVVVVIRVAIRALPRRHSVPARQQKPCGRVVKFSVEPVIAGVACVACRRELRGHVIGIGGRLKILEVARSASRRHRLELAVGPALVTSIAIHSGVRSRQRKTVVVLLDLLNRNLPSPNRVAGLAIGSQLPFVNIGMAVLATLSDVAEHRFYVALSAGDGLVHAAQGVARPVVVEFWNGSNRRPPACCMAILTRNSEVPVRTASSAGHLRLRST